MNVLAISASARKDGNTKIMLETVLNQINKKGIETNLIELSGEIINPCKACFTCDGKEKCSFNGDKFNEVFELMKKADGIILGSPVYSANISSIV
ncbi:MULTISPECIES: flavodoxin family protein [Anaerofustis]|uniref:flavodoxin family protein n=1 Tax=Anaerofustis TaxID=264995 RepID=UPI001FAA4C38|nr:MULTISPECIES: flavodoxin family protein [Anaerofustis]MCO8192893.1 flavodoxin family protein [Anaerofustis sp. NSJ-163]